MKENLITVGIMAVRNIAGERKRKTPHKRKGARRKLKARTKLKNVKKM